MTFRQSDVRVDSLRTGARFWQANGRATHLPTGICVKFAEAWNDRSGRAAALQGLEILVERRDGEIGRESKK